MSAFHERPARDTEIDRLRLCARRARPRPAPRRGGLAIPAPRGRRPGDRRACPRRRPSRCSPRFRRGPPRCTASPSTTGSRWWCWRIAAPRRWCTCSGTAWGPRTSPPACSGVAHFLEHLMFKATGTMEAGELSATVAANGGTDNAFTSWDYTAYFQRVAADRLELMMRHGGGPHGQPAPDAGRHRHRARRDPGRAQPAHGQLARGDLQRAAPGRAVSQPPPTGSPSSAGATRWNGSAWRRCSPSYRAHYAPNNAVLVVAGDVTPEEVRLLAERHYGPIPADPAIAPRPRPRGAAASWWSGA